ncbi:PEP-CTERM sorting domain-containing protein [Aromatoleum diolicum]|uniref:PEP-CTERM sorting domain-containing protein n=1 Tax=Aromatoleum diolicum TaxID=75796 RepID=A0ABX1QAK8_9RHOO|nr:PEP-CTERM sorting domain-containing protein [Aromatoleum diolicum]NMG74432.1 PEP-CTERM sorting domain-containing protein [Aromatoleum diolicum]
MPNWSKALVAGTFALSIGTAQAAFILDTGPGAGGFELTLNNSGVSFQNLGVTFNVSQASSITSVEGWIAPGTGDVLFELHEGSGPTGTLLFSSLVTIGGASDGWRGATGLDWDVIAGDYTLALIAQSGFSGGMPANPTSPAGTEWFMNPLSNGWSTTTFNMGWRVGAEQSTVPEPGSALLLALGLAGLGAVRRRRLGA